MTFGLHFGHDASAAEIAGEGSVRFLNKERVSRTKHALGLSTVDLSGFLKNAPTDNVIGLSSTQGVPIFFDSQVSLELANSQPRSAAEFFGQLPPDHPYRNYAAWDSDMISRKGLLVPEEIFLYETRANRGSNASYEAMAMTAATRPDEVPLMHVDGRLGVAGKSYLVRFYQHHLLHAYYAAFAASADRPALIITGDGGRGPSYFGGGVYFWTPPNRLVPVAPVDDWLGEFYTLVSMAVGFDEGGGPGKLMGLAPYGRPVFFDEHLIGTRRQVTQNNAVVMHKVIEHWFERISVDPATLPNWDRFGACPPGLVADIAASAQAILEVNLMKRLRAAMSMAKRSGHAYEVIALCGGLALNCPANSNLFEAADAPLIVPPAVNDEGLSIGAAVAAHIDNTGAMPAAPANFAEAVYLGHLADEPSVEEAAARHGWHRTTTGEEAINSAVEHLVGGGVMAIFSGRSEIGPRALGHRSILADPRNAGSWRAVNEIKKRETWRPFAPAVLASLSPHFFDRGPEFSPYMLFNYRCTSKELPAITHFDHSSRLQHVTPETGLLFELLSAWSIAGHGPSLMNTSFNGPGVPIVETAEDAFAEANQIGLPLLLTDFGVYRRGTQ